MLTDFLSYVTVVQLKVKAAFKEKKQEKMLEKETKSLKIR